MPDDPRCHLIDEPSKSLIGRFNSLEETIAFVRSLMTVNTDDFLDDLTIACVAREILALEDKANA